MNKFIFLLILIVFTGCSQKQEILVTKRVYPDVSKNAIFDAAKSIFTLSNESNGNKAFLVDAYRNKLEVNKIIFKENIVKIDIISDKWLLEVYQMENESRANLIVVRRDGLDLDDTIDIDENVHELFWDRLDYMLGLNKEWKICSGYFFPNMLNGFCNNYFMAFVPDSKYIQKDIGISKENIKINTIDSVKADILEKTDLTLTKSNKKDIFNQSEEIQDTNMLEPMSTDNIFETEAAKKERIKKEEKKEENAAMEDLKEGELLDVNKQMNKFKEDLENIINKKPQMDDTDSGKIILESDKLKENSEFDLKSKEKSK